MGLQEIINERLAFLQEQIRPQNRPAVNQTFQAQIDAIESSVANIDKIALLVLQKKVKIENSKGIKELDRLFTELEALEWLQRQVVRYSSS